MSEARALDQLLDSVGVMGAALLTCALRELLHAPWSLILGGFLVIVLWDAVRFLRAPRAAAKGEG